MEKLAAFLVIMLVFFIVVFRAGNDFGWGANCRDGYVASYSFTVGWICLQGYKYESIED